MMSDRSKYSTNGVYKIENFAQQVEENDAVIARVSIAEGGHRLYICLIIRGNEIAYPLILSRTDVTFTLRYFFNVLKRDGSSSFKTYSRRTIKTTLRGCEGLKMSITDLLNSENGYLDDGTLSIEYGVHIDAILREDEIWKLNLIDNLFNTNESLTIEYGCSEGGSPNVLYGHKQLLRFHSPHFQNQLTKLEGIRRHEKWIIEECLQIAHGVRIPLGTSKHSLMFTNVFKIASTAHDNKLRNVVQYADQQLVQEDWRANTTELTYSDIFLFADCMEFGLRHFLVDPYEGLKVFLFENCIEFGLRHFFAHSVSRFESLEDLKKIIQQLNMEKMSGEAMKTFAAKIFELGI